MPTQDLNWVMPAEGVMDQISDHPLRVIFFVWIIYMATNLDGRGDIKWKIL